MTNFYPKKDKEVMTADFDSFPEELGNSWIMIHKFNNHRFYSYMFCMYHNDDFPRGTIIVSPYFYHKYPDIYSLYNHPDDNDVYHGVRASINPIHRGKKWWTWYGYMTRVIMWGTFGIHVDVTADRNSKIENFYQKATAAIGQEWQIKNNGRLEYSDEEMPRDVAFPYTWHNNRIVEKVNNEK